MDLINHAMSVPETPQKYPQAMRLELSHDLLALAIFKKMDPDKVKEVQLGKRLLEDRVPGLWGI